MDCMQGWRGRQERTGRTSRKLQMERNPRTLGESWDKIDTDSLYNTQVYTTEGIS